MNSDKLNRQPRAVWLNERGTICRYVCLPGTLSCLWPLEPLQRDPKCARLNIRGTIWNQLKVKGYVAFYQMTYARQFLLLKLKGPPDTLKELFYLNWVKHLRYHTGSVSKFHTSQPISLLQRVRQTPLKWPLVHI